MSYEHNSEISFFINWKIRGMYCTAMKCMKYLVNSLNTPFLRISFKMICVNSGNCAIILLQYTGIYFQDFENALLTLTHNCGVIIEDNQVQIKRSQNKYTTFFSQMFEPFLLGYWVSLLLEWSFDFVCKGNTCTWFMVWLW